MSWLRNFNLLTKAIHFSYLKIIQLQLQFYYHVFFFTSNWPQTGSEIQHWSSLLSSTKAFCFCCFRVLIRLCLQKNLIFTYWHTVWYACDSDTRAELVFLMRAHWNWLVLKGPVDPLGASSETASRPFHVVSCLLVKYRSPPTILLP